MSTQTIIGISNVTVNTENLFHKFVITPYTVVEKKRGRRKKGVAKDETVDGTGISAPATPPLAEGSIVTAKFGDLVRGVDLNHRPRKCKFFRNALTIVMFVCGKLVNFKITKNGRFQFTGCKGVEHAQRCIEYTWAQIAMATAISAGADKLCCNASSGDLYQYTGGSNTFDIKFLTVMTNIDFNIGFPIDRERLDEFINSHSTYNSLLETSFGYTGVNVKVRVDRTLDFDLPCQRFVDGEWQHYTTRYSSFVQEPGNAKYGSKDRYNTFLIFHSGNIIMSGYNPLFMRNCFSAFQKLLITHRADIEEMLDTA